MRVESDRRRTCLITNRLAFRSGPETTEAEMAGRQIEVIAMAARAGCDMVQVREKDLPARDLAALTRRVIEAARPYGTLILVNDRLDVALAAGADGVHLPVSSLTAGQARRITEHLGEFLIGVSTHSIDEALAAESADYIVSGPVFETQSKAAYGPPMGITSFSEIATALSIPVLALGGVTPANFHLAMEAGATGIAGIGIFNDPATVENNIRLIRSWKP